MATKPTIDMVTDEALLSMIEQGITNSVGDFLNSADLARERQKATYEYGMLATSHLQPQGVSQIVSSDTVEAVEGYTAIIAELMFNNNKIARFVPAGDKPADLHNAKVASDLVNYTIFKMNPGWEVLNTWVKSALLWKNSLVRWDFIEDYEYSFEEYEEIDQNNLDIILADDNVEIVGYLKSADEYQPNKETGQTDYVVKYYDVRLKRKIDKTRVTIRNVPPETFRITRDGHGLDDASFVGVQIEMTRSEIRKYFPEVADDIDWDTIGDGSAAWATKYTEEQSARKKLAGEEYWLGGNSRELYPLEANRQVTVIECWLRVDRDGDGIAELKHFIIAGSHILVEEDADSIPLAVICPFEIPHEFHGLSVADMIRPSTLATTAILRGFVENVYLTNYSPKLADPNVVDFSALQNMKPKQVIATNGNPVGAVSALQPDTISQGTVPLLEMLQLHKEQATGLSKAAQGLNDTLYVSGNSEEKMQRAMTAAQVRIQYMVRRFAETGFKRLIEGVYKELRTRMRGKSISYFDSNQFYKTIDPGTLPDNMLMYVEADVGENSNSNIVKKMSIVGQQLIPALQQAGAGGAVNPAAAVRIAVNTLDAMDLDPLDYMVDFTSPDFLKQVEQNRQQEVEQKKRMEMLQDKLQQLDLAQRKATADFTTIQARNTVQDNVKQLMVALDKSHQEWAKLCIMADKEGVERPQIPDPAALLAIAKSFIENDINQGNASPLPGGAQPEQPVNPAMQPITQ